MRRSSSLFVALFAVLALSLALTVPLKAQEKKTQPDRLEGRVQIINKATSTITVRVGQVPRPVVYDKNMKDGQRLICEGKFDDKTRLIATRIDIRSAK